MQFWSKEAALAFLDRLEDVGRGGAQLPPEIIKKREEVRRAYRNAYLFILMLGVVDHGMINYAMRARIELDDLFAEWMTH